MFTRTIGKFLRGKASPFQVMAAAILGSLIGFVPGFDTAPGWLALLLAITLILNANLGVVLLSASGCYLLALYAMPVTFEVGVFLLEGPLRPLFAYLANAPVTAWFGFEYYATTGGIAMGLVVGVVLGWLLVRTLTGFRRKLVALETDSERYQKFSQKGWVKLLTFVFIGGGKGKKSYADLLGKRIGMPIRIVGVVIVVAVGALLYVARDLVAEPVLTQALRDQLGAANGATVDVASVNLDFGSGRLTIAGLAAADPDQLDVDVFRADLLEADVGTKDLLRKRLTVDRIAVHEAHNGSPRERPGVLIGEPEEEEEPETGEPDESGGLGDYASLEDILDDAKDLEAKLEKAMEWLERLTRDTPEPDEDGAIEGESLRDRLEREVFELGYPYVAAKGLIEDTPTLTIREIDVAGLISESFEGDPIDVRANDISTHPWLIEGQPRLSMRARSGDVEVRVGVGPDGTTPQPDGLGFAVRRISTDSLDSWLRIDGEPLVKGGTVDATLEGTWAAGAFGNLDLPLVVTLRDTELFVRGTSAHVAELRLPIQLRGPLDDLSLKIDTDTLQQALLDAGADELMRRFDQEVDELEKKAQDRLDAERAALEQRAAEEKAALERKAEEERKKLEDKAAEELKKKLGGDGGKKLKGLFGDD